MQVTSEKSRVREGRPPGPVRAKPNGRATRPLARLWWHAAAIAAALGNRLRHAQPQGTDRSDRVGRNPCPPKRGKVKVGQFSMKLNTVGRKSRREHGDRLARQPDAQKRR